MIVPSLQSSCRLSDIELVEVLNDVSCQRGHVERCASLLPIGP